MRRKKLTVSRKKPDTVTDAPESEHVAVTRSQFSSQPLFESGNSRRCTRISRPHIVRVGWSGTGRSVLDTSDCLTFYVSIATDPQFIVSVVRVLRRLRRTESNKRRW